MASGLDSDAVPVLLGMLLDGDSAVRYWAAMGLLMRGEEAVQASAEALRELMKDEAAYPQITAAHALAKHGNEAARRAAMAILLACADRENYTVFENMWAWNGIDDMGDAAAPWVAEIKGVEAKLSRRFDRRMGAYSPSLKKAILARIDGKN